MRKKLFVAYILALALNTIAGNVATQTSSSAKTYCHFRPKARSWEERIDEADAEHDYTLFSDGMPSEAVVIINGQEFRGLNAQGDAHIKSAKLETANVKVKVGGGYVAKVSVDNANYQIDVKFIQLFTPTISVDAERQYPYILYTPAAFVKKTEENLSHTTHRSKADKFIFIEKTYGQYYIYDQTANCYIYYTIAQNGGNAKTTTNSHHSGLSSRPEHIFASMEFHRRHRGRQHAQPLDSKRRQFCMGDHRPCSSLHALRVPYVCAARSSISPQVDYPRRRDRVECRFWLNINAFAQRRPYRDGQQIQVCGRRCPKSRGRIHLHGKSRGCGWRRKASQDPAGRQQPLAVGHP